MPASECLYVFGLAEAIHSMQKYAVLENSMTLGAAQERKPCDATSSQLPQSFLLGRLYEHLSAAEVDQSGFSEDCLTNARLPGLLDAIT